MAFQTVFKRYELKYMLTLEQKEKILEAMSLYMELDKYGRTTIRNIYFDTDNYRLIRRSALFASVAHPVRQRRSSRSFLLWAQVSSQAWVISDLRLSLP